MSSTVLAGDSVTVSDATGPGSARRPDAAALALAALSGRPAGALSDDPGLTGLIAALAREPDGSTAQRVAELAQSIVLGQRAVTSQNLDLLAAYERLERLGRPLNAVASVARVPARAADGPLAGQPVAVKDIIAVAGLPTRCGSPASDPA